MTKSSTTTPATGKAVEAFLDAVPDKQRQADSRELLKVMQRATGASPVMWGTAIVGFDLNRYTYASGKDAESLAVGFSPRKQAFVLYGVDHASAEAKQLGPHETGKACLYIKKLDDVDLKVLAGTVR